jgi:LPS-assembly protein
LEGRGSGFLAPDFDTYHESTSKTQESKVRIPYYFNIAPDRDLILAYSYMSSRGSIIEGKYRQLIDRNGNKDSTFEIDSQYLFKDDITKLNRWLVDTSTELDISNNIHLSARFNRVSDKNYFKEIVHTNTDADRLISHLKVSFKNPKKNLSANLLTEDEQIVNNGSPTYTRALEGSIYKTFNAEGDLPFQAGLVTTQFSHDDASKDSGTRIHGTLGTSKTISRKFPIITTGADVSTTYYSLNIKDNITRTTAGASIDFAFPMISQRELFNAQVTRTITPKISYNYRGKVVQGNIPIFDTTDTYDDAITFAALTSGERYTGLDRISNANDITLSLETGYINLDSEKELFNYRIAQSYYADDEVVSNSTNTDFEKRRSYSDVVAGLDLAVNQFAFSSNLQFDPEINKVTNRTNAISYKLNPKKFVSLTHTTDGSTSTVKLYGAYPVNDSIHLFGAIDQNTTTGKTNKGTAGAVYDSCCWAMRGAFFKEGVSNYGIGFELILKGIGSSSTNLGKRIKGHIPYYEANLNE